MRRNAFTLVELLVVIAIIALLIAILLPALRLAHSRALTLQCLTNLRSIGQGGLMYALDYGWLPRDDTPAQGMGYQVLLPEAAAPLLSAYTYPMLPPALDPLQGGGGSVLERDRRLAALFKELDWLQCPTFPGTPHSAYTVQHPFGSSSVVIDQQVYDYVVNAFQLLHLRRSDTPTNTQYIGLTRPNRIPRPSELIYVTEASEDRPLHRFDWHDAFQERHLSRGSAPRIARINDKRHLGRINAVFFDGSARTLYLTEIGPELFTDIPTSDPGFPR